MCRLANRLDDLTGTVARCRRAVDGDGIEKVEARKVGRPVGLGQAHELAQRCHAAIGSAHIHQVERLRIYAVLRRCLHGDVIEFGETVEVRHIRPGIIAGERGKHIGRGHARLLAFRRVNIHPILGIVSGKRRIDLSDFGTAGQSLYESVRLFLECGNVSARFILQVEFKTVAHAVAGNHRRRHGKHRGIGNISGDGINLAYHVVHRLPFAFALVPIFECHEIHCL